jgi:hypothetical protein
MVDSSAQCRSLLSHRFIRQEYGIVRRRGSGVWQRCEYRRVLFPASFSFFIVVAAVLFLTFSASECGPFSNVVDILCHATSTTPCPAIVTTTALSTTIPATTASYSPNTTASYSPNTTASYPPNVPHLLPPASPIPTFITAGAVLTSGHMPRVLELVQFLSIFCTSLSWKQQNRLNEFQVSSLTHFTSKNKEQCSICPGSCIHPLALVVPIFALVACLFAFGIIIILLDCRKSQKSTNSGRPALLHDRLIDSDGDHAKKRVSLLRNAATFFFRYARSVIEASSSYLLMPCFFVFILNIRPSSFSQASLLDRAMIFATPIVALLFRTLVIRQHVVHLSPADQKQLYTGGVCSCAITVIFGVYFNQVDDNLTQATVTSPLYIALAVLTAQLIVQTAIRAKATEASIFDSKDWPWSAADSESSSTSFSCQARPLSRVVAHNKAASSSATILVAKFFVLNYLVISQIVLIAAGIASAGLYSESSLNNYSIAMGCVPLISSGALLLHNAVKFVIFLRRKMLKNSRHADFHRSIESGKYF